MITLYYHRGRCSTSNHIALEEAGVEYVAIEADLMDESDPAAAEVRALNPMAMTPVLVLDDGSVLTQNVATLTYIADLSPERGLLPTPGTIERSLAESWLAFVACDLHPVIIEYGYKTVVQSEVERARISAFYEDRVARRLKVLEDRLATNAFILGDRYSVVDPYALIALRWSTPAGLSLAAYPNIMAYMDRIEARPAVQRVRKAEGPIGW